MRCKGALTHEQVMRLKPWPGNAVAVIDDGRTVYLISPPRRHNNAATVDTRCWCQMLPQGPDHRDRRHRARRAGEGVGVMREPVKFAKFEVTECVFLARPPSDTPFPVPRPWYRRLVDWLLRRPVPMTSEREQMDAYLEHRYVATWRDQSGNGNHITQADAGQRPVRGGDEAASGAPSGRPGSPEQG